MQARTKNYCPIKRLKRLSVKFYCLLNNESNNGMILFIFLEKGGIYIIEKRNINIVLSDFVLRELNLYIEYVGMSRSSCIAYFLSKQIIEFKCNRNIFMENWKKRRYKPMATDMNYDGASEHLKRFSVSVSEDLYGELLSIQDKLNVPLPKLTTNMIVMELLYLFGTREVEFSHRKNQIKKGYLRDKIPISNLFGSRIDTIAEKIGIPRNALIAQILAEYLINNYDYYHDDWYIDDNGRNYSGVW